MHRLTHTWWDSMDYNDQLRIRTPVSLKTMKRGAREEIVHGVVAKHGARNFHIPFSSLLRIFVRSFNTILNLPKIVVLVLIHSYHAPEVFQSQPPRSYIEHPATASQRLPYPALNPSISASPNLSNQYDCVETRLQSTLCFLPPILEIPRLSHSSHIGSTRHRRCQAVAVGQIRRGQSLTRDSKRPNADHKSLEQYIPTRPPPLYLRAHVLLRRRRAALHLLAPILHELRIRRERHTILGGSLRDGQEHSRDDDDAATRRTVSRHVNKLGSRGVA